MRKKGETGIETGDLPIAPRAMTWEEREAFIEAGLDPVFMEEKISPQWERKVIKWILEDIYKGCEYAKLTFPQCRRLAFKTYELTVRAEDAEIKNS